jgi:hypothetical protein
MARSAHRYLVGLIAFAATVTLFAEGIAITIAGLAACAAVVYGDRIVSFERRRRHQRPARTGARRPIREEPYQLVPDEPSLILSPEL